MISESVAKQRGAEQDGDDHARERERVPVQLHAEQRTPACR